MGLAGCAAVNDVSRLEDEVRRLQALVDELQKKQAESQVRLQEVRERQAPGETAAGPAEPGTQAATPQPPIDKPPAGAAPHQIYNSAFTQYNLGRHPEAIQLFRTFLRSFPRHDLADNAQYWIGECHFARKEYDQAAEEFQRVVTEYPQGNKVPDAFVKKGMALLELDRRDEAVESLRTVVEAYPKSDAAAYARQRLGEIQKGGRPASRR